MVTRKLYSGTDGRLLISIPAFLRDHFGMRGGDNVSIDLENEKIVITPLKEQ